MYLSSMRIQDIIEYLEKIAPPAYQENYDNSGLLVGSRELDCSGVLISLDATEEVILEAVEKNCNLVVSHHPIIFSGLKTITGKNYIGKAVITAIKNDIALYAIHTNLDNVYQGVNGRIAQMLELKNTRILQFRESIGQYSHCSFNVAGTGTFKAKPGADPYLGEVGKLTNAGEIRFEVIFPSYLQSSIIKALMAAHPYEEVAFDIVSLSNLYQEIGSGMMGELPEPMPERAFLEKLKETFLTPVVKHTALTGRQISRVAVCGGAGSFLLPAAVSAGADIFITSDMKYHQFFDANGQIVIADIGHYESEQFTIQLLHEILEQKFPTFAVLKTTVATNPVRYFM
jgi:dinuclear metal center YbgI/SA1388 family protein